MKKGYLLFILAGTVLLGGCGQPSRPPEPVSLLCADAPTPALFEAAVEVLQDMQFQLAAADPDAGLIRTWPLRGGQFFEPWRDDNASARMAALSNLHSIRRVVELELTTSMGRACVESRVFVQRLSAPGEFYGGTRQMAALFTGGNYARQSLTLEEELAEEAAWEDLGRDPALEQELLTKIENELQKD